MMSHHRIVKRIRTNYQHTGHVDREASCECCATRNEKLRCLAKSRREQEGEQFALLTDLLPFPPEVKAKMDKVGVLRLAVAYLKAKHLVRRSKGNQRHVLFPAVKEAQAMLNTLDGFLIVVGHDGQIIYLSEQVTTCLGFQSYEMIGANILEFVCPPDQVILLKNCLKKKSKNNLSENSSFEDMETDEAASDSDEETLIDVTQQQKEFVIRMKYKITQNDKGKQTGYIPVQWSGKPKKLDLGHRPRASLCLGLVAICRPIMSAFMEVDLYQHTFVVRYSANHLLTYIDERVTRFLGYDPGELLGSCLIDYYHPEDFHKVIRTFAKDMWEKGSNVTDRFRVINKRGEWVWMQSHGAVVYGPQKEPLFAILIAHISQDQGNMLPAPPATSKDRFNNNTLKEAVAAESEMRTGQCKHRGRHVCLKFQMEREYGCRPPTPDNTPATHMFSSSPEPVCMENSKDMPFTPRQMSGQYKNATETVKKVNPKSPASPLQNSLLINYSPSFYPSKRDQSDRSLLHDLLQRKRENGANTVEPTKKGGTLIHHLNIKDISGDVSLKDLLSGRSTLSTNQNPSRMANTTIPLANSTNRNLDSKPVPLFDKDKTVATPFGYSNTLNEKIGRLPEAVSNISIKEEDPQIVPDTNMINSNVLNDLSQESADMVSNVTLSPISSSTSTHSPYQGANLTSPAATVSSEFIAQDAYENNSVFSPMETVDSPISVNSSSESELVVIPSAQDDITCVSSPNAPQDNTTLYHTVPFIDYSNNLNATNQPQPGLFQESIDQTSLQNIIEGSNNTRSSNGWHNLTNIMSDTNSSLNWTKELNGPQSTLSSVENNGSGMDLFQDPTWQEPALVPLPNLSLQDIDHTLHSEEESNSVQSFPQLTETLLDTPQPQVVGEAIPFSFFQTQTKHKQEGDTLKSLLRTRAAARNILNCAP